MAICCRMVESVAALKKLLARSPKTTSATTSTIIGTAEGVWCSQCCSFFSRLSGSWNSATVSAAPARPAS